MYVCIYLGKRDQICFTMIEVQDEYIIILYDVHHI